MIAIDIPHPGATYFGANNYQAGAARRTLSGALGEAARGTARWTRFCCSSSRAPARCVRRDERRPRRASRGAPRRRGRAGRVASTATGSSRPRSSACAGISVSRRRGAFWSAPPTIRARSARRAPSRRPAATRTARSSARTPSRTRAPNCASRGRPLVASVGLLPRALRRRSHPARARHPGAAARAAGRVRSRIRSITRRKRRPPLSERRAASGGAAHRACVSEGVSLRLARQVGWNYAVGVDCPD